MALAAPHQPVIKGVTRSLTNRALSSLSSQNLARLGFAIPYVGQAVNAGLTGYQLYQLYKSMPKRTRSGKSYNTPVKRIRHRYSAPTPQITELQDAGVQVDIGHTTAQPATSVIDSTRPTSILVTKRSKRKLSKKAKKYKAKKKRFAKSVKKVIIKLGPSNIWKESCTGAFNLNNRSDVFNWNTSMGQAYTFAPENGSGGFGYGSQLDATNVRDNDCWKLLNYQDNELFLYTTENSTDARQDTIANLTSAATRFIKSSATSGKVYISKIEYTISVRNQATHPLTVDVYQMVAQKNFAGDSPYSNARKAYDQCRSQENFTYDVETPGVAQAQAKVKFEDPQASPMDIPNYSKYWKPKTGTRLLLQAGETKMLTFYGSKGWYDGRKANGLYALKDFTNEFLYIVGGGPCPGWTNSATTMPAITWTKEIRWRQEEGFQKPQNVALSRAVTY